MRYKVNLSLNEGFFREIKESLHKLLKFDFSVPECKIELKKKFDVLESGE